MIINNSLTISIFETVQIIIHFDLIGLELDWIDIIISPVNPIKYYYYHFSLFDFWCWLNN